MKRNSLIFTLCFLFFSAWYGTASYGQSAPGVPTQVSYGLNEQGDSVVLDVLPTFQGQKSGAFQVWVQKNVTQPEPDVQGQVLVSFFVDRDGMLSEVEVLRSTDEMCSQAVLSTLERAPGWNPGMSGGKPAKVKYLASVRFAPPRPEGEWEQVNRFLQDSMQMERELNSRPIDKMPRFRGKDPSAFREWASSRVRYPQTHARNQAEGIVIVCFVVDKDGTLTDITLPRAFDPYFAEEVLRVVRSSPKWEPGTSGGEPIPVSLTLPFMFRFR